jgi:hypothetical protein
MDVFWWRLLLVVVSPFVVFFGLYLYVLYLEKKELKKYELER